MAVRVVDCAHCKFTPTHVVRAPTFGAQGSHAARHAGPALSTRPMATCGPWAALKVVCAQSHNWAPEVR